PPGLLRHALPLISFLVSGTSASPLVFTYQLRLSQDVIPQGVEQLLSPRAWREREVCVEGVELEDIPVLAVGARRARPTVAQIAEAVRPLPRTRGEHRILGHTFCQLTAARR